MPAQLWIENNIEKHNLINSRFRCVCLWVFVCVFFVYWYTLQKCNAAAILVTVFVFEFCMHFYVIVDVYYVSSNQPNRPHLMNLS